jgi:hypothetical protein
MIMDGDHMLALRLHPAFDESRMDEERRPAIN